MTALSRTRAPYICLLLVALFLWGPFFLLGPYSYFTMGDNGDFVVPVNIALSRHMSLGEYWLPFIMGGIDRLAHGSTTPFDHLTFYLFPPWIAYQLNVAIQVGMIGLFSVKLMRERFGVSADVAAVVALLLGWRYVHGHTFQVIWALVPAVLWATYRLADTKSWHARIGGAVLMGVVFGLTANPVTFVNSIVVFILIWFLLIETKINLRIIVTVFLFLLTTTLCLAPDIIAIALASADSQRGAIQTPENLATLLRLVNSPIEVAAIAVIVFALIKRGGDRLCLARIGAGGIVLVAGYVLAVVLKTNFPEQTSFLQGARMSRVQLPVDYFLYIGAGYALAMIKPSDGRTPGTFRDLVKRNIVYVFVALLFVSSFTDQYLRVQRWVVDGNYVANYRIETFEQLVSARLSSDEPFRIATHEIAASLPAAYGLEAASGYATQFPERYRQFWIAMLDDGELLGRYNIVEIVCPQRARERDPIQGCFNVDMLGLLNVRYLVSRRLFEDSRLEIVKAPQTMWSTLDQREKIESNLRANFVGRSNYFVYRVESELPRAFVVGDLRVFEDRKGVRSALRSATKQDIRSHVFVAAEDLPADRVVAGSSAEASANYRVIRNGHYEVRVATKRAAILVVSHTYSRYVKAFVDGEEAEVFPAYDTLWGVFVGAGEHRVEFKYQPPYDLRRGP